MTNPGARGDPTSTSQSSQTDGPAPKALPFYRRRAFLATVGVTAVVAIAVVTDLPSHASHSDEVNADRALVTQMNKFAAPCVFALNEARTFYREVANHQLSASDRAKLPGFLRDDYLACSRTDDSVVQLVDLETPGTAAGRTLGAVRDATLIWIFPDAFNVIGDLIHLEGSVGSPRWDEALRRDAATTNAALGGINTLMHKASNQLNASLPSLGLKRVQP